MTKEEYLILFEKHLAGKTTSDEENALISYRDGLNVHHFDNGEPVVSQDIIRQRIFDGIEKRIHKPVKKMYTSYWWAAAASLVLFITIAGIWYNHQEGKPQQVAVKPAVASPIFPGDNKATLTLANGRVVNLDTTQDGLIQKTDNLSITKTKSGELVYSSNSASSNTALAYNTISTPKGGQYQVILPDGTHVWLNAASSLKYPEQFTGAERHVELSGEAYFEVAKNKDMPFTIASNKADVKVLGTHFNVMAYDDEPAIKTTLLEGSVMLSNQRGRAILKPGQQGRIAAKDAKIELQTVNTDDVVSWKNGYFSFRNNDLVSVMKNIARWYNVSIEYEGDFNGVELGGTISRTKTLNELLHKIELTGTVKFKIEGRRVIVKT